jgi:hypothetical protein
MFHDLKARLRRFFSIFEVPVLILAIVACSGCTPAALASILGFAQAAAPVASVALTEYQKILEAARSTADLPPDDPQVKNLAALLSRLEVAKQCETTERTASSVDLDKVTAALRTVADTNAAVTAALDRMPRRARLPRHVLPSASSSAAPASSAPPAASSSAAPASSGSSSRPCPARVPPMGSTPDCFLDSGE